MHYDFTMTLPVPAELRRVLLDLFTVPPSLPVGLTVLGRPAKIYQITSDDPRSVTVTGHFQVIVGDDAESPISLPWLN